MGSRGPRKPRCWPCWRPCNDRSRRSTMPISRMWCIMSETCTYVEHGERVHEGIATHVALERRRTNGTTHWDIYEAESLEEPCAPEFCLWHAMQVALHRTRAQAREQQRREGKVQA